MMRFKTDENIHPDASLLLVQHGCDAITVWDQKLRGASDDTLLDVCKLEKRTLITFDRDFADIRNYPPASYYGIIVLRLKRQSRRTTLACIKSIISSITAREIRGELWVVTERIIRIRR